MKRLKYSIVIVLFVILSAVLFACGKEPPKTFTVEYMVCSNGGGIVYGNIYQSVEEGESGTQVIAVANDGYEFVGWSDGIETAARIDSEITSDLSVTAKFEKIVTYKLTYISQSGGAVYGAVYQTVEEGESGTQVIAVANDGYEFVGWSDGIETVTRIDSGVTADMSVTAKFEEIRMYTLEYFADDGCYIVGSELQIVRDGEAGNPVEVKCVNGYRFVGWSDNVMTARRQECEVTDDITAIAKTEKIVIEFYSDDYLVREINVSDINTADLSTIVGYKSKFEFVGWKYHDEVVTEGLFINALYSIKAQYNKFGITDVDNIKLQAVYQESADGNVIGNYMTIAHALGGYQDQSYVNSLEAFEYNYGLGQRFFEVDIAMTSDGRYVAAHDWGSFTYDAIKNKYAQKNLTLLDIADIVYLVNEYQDIVLDLDILGLCRGNAVSAYDSIFEEFYKTLDVAVYGYNPTIYERLILEVLPVENTKMFEYAKQFSGLTHFLYAEYYGSTYPLVDNDSFDLVGQYCRENGIEYLSINYLTKEQVDILHSYGVYVMIFTYNDPITMYEYYDIGVDCIFTDFSYM